METPSLTASGHSDRECPGRDRFLGLGARCRRAPESGALFGRVGNRLGSDFGPVDKLDEGHRRVVADPKAHLQDARVAARARLVARADLGEQLGDDRPITGAVGWP